MLTIRPPNIVDWAESNIVLPKLGNVRPGPLRLDGWQKECLRAMADTCNDYVALACASQLGKSQVTDTYVKYRIANDPANIIFAMPTLDDLQYYHRAKFLANLRSSPALSGLLEGRHRPGEEVSLGNVAYRGGMMRYVNANAGRSWRGSTGSVLIADELDSFPGSMDANNPVQMLRQRSGSIPDQEVSMVLASTPVRGKFMDDYYAEGSRGEFVVRCIACSHPFVWSFRPEYVEAGYVPCTECGATFSDSEIVGMNAEGWFIHANPNAAAKTFHITQFASTRKSHRDTLSHYDPVSPRGFYTQIMAQSFEDVADTLTPRSIDALWVRERPGRPQVTTAGVDVQGNRLEWSLVEWRSANTRAHVLRHRAAYYEGGSNASEEGKQRAWLEMANDVRAARWVFVDSGYKPDEVRRLVLMHLGQVKGMAAHGAKTADDLQNPAGLIMGIASGGDVRLGTQQAKSVIAEMIARQDLTVNPDGVPHGGWEDYLEQLTAEQLVISPDGRRQSWQKVTRGRRNEALDCLVLALCAALWPATNAGKRHLTRF